MDPRRKTRRRRRITVARASRPARSALIRALPLLLLAQPLFAADTRLDAIRELLAPLRTNDLANHKSRGATPAFTTLKHRLRDWIESRLAELKWNGTEWKPDPSIFQEQLNQDLGKAGLFCGDEWKIPCREWSLLGFLGDISLEMKAGSFLVVKTALGIECGYDESAYVYKSDGGRWQRLWQSEQDDYRGDKYFPQTFDEVAISPTNYEKDADKSAHLILTLGHNPWCTSNWQTVYYRVWHTSNAVAAPALLLDGREIGFIEEIRGTVSRHDVLFQYYVESIEGDTRVPRSGVAFWLTGSPR